MALYGRVEYWDERYRTSRGPYEWYQNYGSLRHLFTPETLKTTSSQDFSPRSQSRVLILGCGNSEMADHMRKDGWTGPMVQVDFSQVVINQMKARHDSAEASGTADRDSNMTFLCADVTADPLPYRDASFDLIVIKGTFDAILCSQGSVYSAKRVVRECVRLLDSGGVLFLVSYGNPDSRTIFLEYDDHATKTHDLSRYWQEVSTHTVYRQRGGEARTPTGSEGRGGGHQHGAKKDFVYICRKVREDNRFVPANEPNAAATIATNEATGIASEPSAKFAQMALVGN